MREVIIWDGPGWYGSRQEGNHEQVVVTYQIVPEDTELDESQIHDKAYLEHLGTPEFISSKDLEDMLKNGVELFRP